MTLFEYICDHSYSLISLTLWLIVVKIIEKYSFYNYIGYNKYHVVKEYYFRCVLSAISYACMGHAMYLMTSGEKISRHIIIFYFLQLFLDMSWFLVFYIMSMLRTSAIISALNVLLSVYNFLTWNSMSAVIGACISPFMVVSSLHLLLNYNVISLSKKSEKSQ
ncbi:hypothetical protein FPV037 [Fowlpox virus]|uniref:Uncharacterized protein n=2 Tax=Fowlpox virus TaxID=10261 RepID=Q9J5G6_FOWPN|nr:hypothetical protein FPV037 [Fowlpox virus]UNS14226.1 ALPV-062 [Albatrosspox virus]WPD90999.1 hypothetical protein PPV-Vac110-fpv037 [Avipoxvirus sp.]CAE52583.1 fp9.037 [Fowlpox virus isolate HP-438/Munich]AAF44381.1 ORF FPV037 hypothetical protein [Fowlpox virus]ART91471.1 hypothetical protein [Fowlpox virus]